MWIIQCDLCRKQIDRASTVRIELDFAKKAELCTDCAAPILRFLKKHKFIRKDGVTFEERLLS